MLKPIILCTAVGSYCGSLLAATYDVELGALVLAGVSLLGVLIWAWLCKRLDERYDDKYVSRKDCLNWHNRSVDETKAIFKQLGEIKTEVAETRENVGYLRGRYDGKWPVNENNLQHDIQKLLDDQQRNERLAAQGREDAATGREDAATGREDAATGREDAATGREDAATDRKLHSS